MIQKYITPLILFMMLLFLGQCNHQGPMQFASVNSLPPIDPDYSDLVIPPNIAPLNFRIQDNVSGVYVEIHGSGHHIQISSRDADVEIPLKAWQTMLHASKGDSIRWDIYAQSNGLWTKYKPIVNYVSQDEIDSHVVYRLINPGYVGWNQMGIYQRNLGTFEETSIFTNQYTNKNCMNCHAFCQNNPNQMLFHMRAGYGGTIFWKEGQLTKVDTKTEAMHSAGVYPAWHPDGRHVAFSANQIFQLFHGQTGDNIYVFDEHSNLMVFDTETNTLTTSPEVCTNRLENLPCWSPDGRFLYYIRAEKQADMKYDAIQYDLMRIACDVNTNTWGEPEILVSSAETGKSMTFPKVSPDGRYLLFCMCDYGYFSVHFKSSDLYLMDLATHKITKPDINSNHVESYHAWSSNSRWFVLVSKRRDELCSRLYFSHIDTNGQVSKPFLMPEKDPDFYDTFLLNYNLPEMIQGKVNIPKEVLVRIARGKGESVQVDPKVKLDGMTEASVATGTRIPMKY